MKSPEGIQLHCVVSAGFVASFFFIMKLSYLFPCDAENTLKCVLGFYSSYFCRSPNVSELYRPRK